MCPACMIESAYICIVLLCSITHLLMLTMLESLGRHIVLGMDPIRVVVSVGVFVAFVCTLTYEPSDRFLPTLHRYFIVTAKRNY